MQSVNQVAKKNSVCRFQLEQKIRRRYGLQRRPDFEYGFRQVLEDDEIAVMESEALGGESFQHSHYLAGERDGCRQHRAHTKSAADLGINAGITVRIVAALRFGGTDTLSRKTSADVQAGAERRGVSSYTGETDHRLLVT